MLAGHADFGTTANTYAHLDASDLETALRQSSHLKMTISRESGGGGNRTRVRGRTEQSVYERSSRFISLGGRFANDPPPSQPS